MVWLVIVFCSFSVLFEREWDVVRRVFFSFLRVSSVCLVRFSRDVLGDVSVFLKNGSFMRCSFVWVPFCLIGCECFLRGCLRLRLLIRQRFGVGLGGCVS